MATKKIKPNPTADLHHHPFYRYGEGFWMIDDRKKCPETGNYVRLKARWFPTESAAKMQYDALLRKAFQKERTKGWQKSAENPVWEAFVSAFLADRAEAV